MSQIQCLQNDIQIVNVQVPETPPPPPKRKSDVLICVGGDRAQELAELSEFPHEPIINAPASVLHFVAYRLSVSENPEAAAKAALNAKNWPADPSKTLERHCSRALFQKLTLPVWQKADYQRLASLLIHQNARKALRHKDVIYPVDVQTLAELPAFARKSRIRGFMACRHEAEFFGKIFEKIVSDAPARQCAFAQRINGAKSRKQLWRAVYEEVIGAKPDYPRVPVDLPDGYCQIRNTNDLLRTARKFQNCIKSYDTELGQGAIAFIVRTKAPEAVIEVAPRLNGLVFDEIRGKKNEHFEKAVLATIEAELSSVGLRKGPIGRLHISEDQLTWIVDSLMRIGGGEENGRACKRAKAGIEILKSGDFSRAEEFDILLDLDEI